MTGAARAFGPYLVGALLGRGQMGEVHRAVDTAHGDRPVALKVLAPGARDEPGYEARFRAEARRAARLSDPHVVPVLDYGEIDGRLYLAMQLVEGRTLARELAGSGPMDPARAVGIIGQVAAALDAAHAAGLVHRDVKPSNILLSVPGEGRAEFAQLADFGLAHPTEPGSSTALTRTGSVMGSLAYMAPERFLARPATPACDVYSLTCVLHELLTGARPYPGEGHGVQVAGHLQAPPPRPGAVRPGLPGGFDGVVACGMAKAPEARFRTAGELAAAARGALASPRSSGAAPAPAPTHPGFPPPVAATPRRTHTLAIAGAAVAAAAVVALAAALVVPTLGAPGARPAAAAPAPQTAATPSGGPVTERVLTGAAPDLTTPPVIARIGDVPVLVLQQNYSYRVVDLATGQQLGATIAGQVAEFGGATATLLNGRSVVVTGGTDNVIRLWDLTTGVALPMTLTGHTGAVTTVAVLDLPNGPRLVSASRDGTVRQWDLAAGTAIGPPLTGAGQDVEAFTLSRTGAHGDVLRAGTLQDQVWSWSLNSGTPFGPPVECRGLSSVATVEPPTGDTQLVCADLDSRYTLVDAVSGAVTRPPGTTYDLIDHVAAARLADRQTVVLADNSTLQIVDAVTDLPIGGPLTGHEGAIEWLGTFTSGGSVFLVSSSQDRSVRIWNLSERAKG